MPKSESKLVKGSHFIPSCGASAVLEDPEKILHIEDEFDEVQKTYEFIANYVSKRHRATPTELYENCKTMFGLDCRSVQILCNRMIDDGQLFKVHFGNRNVYLDYVGVTRRTHMFEWLTKECWHGGTAEDHKLYLLRYGHFCSREEFSKLIDIPSKTLKYYMQCVGITASSAWKGWATQRQK